VAGIDFEAEFIAHRYADRPSVTITVEGADGALERSADVTRGEMSRIEESDEVGAAVLQATLMEGGVVARADALEYAGGNEWDVLEVKSCAKTKSRIPPSHPRLPLRTSTHPSARTHTQIHTREDEKSDKDAFVPSDVCVILKPQFQCLNPKPQTLSKPQFQCLNPKPQTLSKPQFQCLLT